jgi:tetratricopeptide (TPR) repeat protein
MRFLTGCSSKVGPADSENVVRHGGLIQHMVVSHLAQNIYSQEAFLKLTDALIHSVEQAYNLRDLDALQEVSRALMNLPIDAARQIGLYYHALAINRKGLRDEAEALLETVADNAPMSYRARAIQTLGANYHDKGQLDEAFRFQVEALRAASDRNANGLQATLLAHWEISIVKSLDGDHEGAFSDLHKLSPLVSLIAKQKPFYFYAYCNALAVGLGELDRIAEAEAACTIALTSPFARAYPEWAETRLELEAKRTSATPSLVAINRAPEAKPSTPPEPQPKPHQSKPLPFNWLAVKTTFLQRASKTIAVTEAISVYRTTQSVLDRMLICIGPRAPPARS